MKQHMLTHKIRDMPQHMFGSPTASASSTDSRAEKSGRRSVDYQDSEKSSGPSYTNNNNQREKNLNNADSKAKMEPGMKRPSSNEVDDTHSTKRPLSEYFRILKIFTLLLETVV